MRIVQAFTAAMLALGAVAPATAIAQNLVTNPEFTTSAAGWSPFGGGTVNWAQADGTPTPGALDFVHGGACDCEQFATQCVAVTPGARYQFLYATKRMAADSPTHATVYARVVWANLPDCGNSIGLLTGDGFVLDTLPVGTWQQRGGGAFDVPLTATSVRVQLGAAYTAAPPLLLRFDDVYLGPLPDEVFVSGFEDP